jgi:hypothetical protein
MNIAVPLPADAPIGAEPLLEFSPLRPGLSTVTALYKEWHRLREACGDDTPDGECRRLTNYLCLVEDALGWMPAANAEECMMQFEVLYENEQTLGKSTLFDEGSLACNSSRQILKMFIEGMGDLKSK